MREQLADLQGSLEKIGDELAKMPDVPNSKTKTILQAEFQNYQEALENMVEDNLLYPEEDISELIQNAGETFIQFKSEVQLRSALAQLTVAKTKLDKEDTFTARRLKSEIQHQTELIKPLADPPKGKSVDTLSSNYVQYVEALKSGVDQLIREVNTPVNATPTASTESKRASTSEGSSRQSINETPVSQTSHRRSLREIASGGMNRLSTTFSPKTIGEAVTSFTNNLPSAKGIMGGATQMMRSATQFISDVASRLPSPKEIVNSITTFASEAVKRLPTFGSKTDSPLQKPESKKSTQAELIQKLVSEKATTKVVPTTNPNVQVTIDASKVNQLFEQLSAESNKPTSAAATQQSERAPNQDKKTQAAPQTKDVKPAKGEGTDQQSPNQSWAKSVAERKAATAERKAELIANTGHKPRTHRI